MKPRSNAAAVSLCMCGLAGFWNRMCSESPESLQSTVTAMIDALRHRGPDDQGTWTDPGHGIALGHRRLAILDLSPAGHQPQVSQSGRYVLIYNGEIYNFAAVRQELAACGRAFRGQSDTEVLLEAISEWGVEAATRRCAGMFAFAVWDRQEHLLSLVRDRFGKKPLYYGRFGRRLIFGSELKALRTHPEFIPTIDRQALAGYLRWGYIRHPQSIYEQVRTLPPATIATWHAECDEPRLMSYWTPDSAPAEPPPATAEAAVDRLDTALTEAVRCRMVADVPVGAFLSGGIDSSLVVALMQKVSPSPVRTFTIGFEDPAYNEAPDAARIAAHLRTEHTELTVTAAEARDVIPRLTAMTDEPFGDSSLIPTSLVCALARGAVTVALSGDGGDEVFCGYRRYFEAFRGFEGGTLGATLGLLRVPSRWGVPVRGLVSILRNRFAPNGGWLARIDSLLQERSPADRYLRNLSHWQPESAAVLGAHCVRESLDEGHSREGWQRIFQGYDLRTYLPDDILTKVDRASMAVSLEVRAPLLDHRLLETVQHWPHSLFANHTQGKRILRQVLARYVPPTLFDRKKTGFGIPLGDWLRGPLVDWAEHLLGESRLRDEGFLNVQLIRECWTQHCRGVRNWQYPLWTVLMFQAWLDDQRVANRSPLATVKSV